jgi:hypothetical protein
MTLYAIVAFDNTVAFVSPLFALLTSSPVMWSEEQNFTLRNSKGNSSQSCNITMSSNSTSPNGTVKISAYDLYVLQNPRFKSGVLKNLLREYKCKGKAVPLHAMEALGGRGGIAPTHSRPRH